MRFIEKATTEAVAYFVGISEKEVRSSELKALKFFKSPLTIRSRVRIKAQV